MSRPTPRILTQQRLGKTDWEIRIQAGDGFWCVMYQDQPINIVKDYYYADRKKYMRNGFAHEGHAVNLARKLNAQFDTQDFTVKRLI